MTINQGKEWRDNWQYCRQKLGAVYKNNILKREKEKMN